MSDAVIVYFDNTVRCCYCACDSQPCIVCDGSGIMDTLESVDREDIVEPVQFIHEEHYT